MLALINYLLGLPLWLAALAVIAAISALAAVSVFALSVLREAALQARAGATSAAALLFSGGAVFVRATIRAVRMLAFAFWTGVLLICGRPCRAAARLANGAGKWILMANHFARTGHREFKSFAEYRAAMGEEGEDDQPRAKGPRVDDLPAYERALAILGMTREEAASMKDVRIRYRELQSVLHPDKGNVKSSLFSAMVNEALEIVRKEHGLA